MSLHLIFNELRQLQTSLQKASDRLWAIRKSITVAHHQGQLETDFLPRRLIALKNEEEIRFDNLLDQLKGVISSNLGRALLPLNSSDDVKVIIGIRKTIRYIRNAFAGELPLSFALDKIHQSLPSRGATNG
ncbi:MAG: hypothetical protein HY541_09035 [Deltaproteobacteria bacterium]|nr:hypothetical protein [Deltaproteobacteria bacterium]